MTSPIENGDCIRYPRFDVISVANRMPYEKRLSFDPSGYEDAKARLIKQHRLNTRFIPPDNLITMVQQHDPEIEQAKSVVAQASPKRRHHWRIELFTQPLLYGDILRNASLLYTFASADLLFNLKSGVFNIALESHRNLARHIQNNSILGNSSREKQWAQTLVEIINQQNNHEEVAELLLLRSFIHTAALDGLLGVAGLTSFDPYAIIDPEIFYE